MNHLPAGRADAEYVAGVVSVINTETNAVEGNIKLPDGSTNLRGIAMSPDGKYAYVTHILGRHRIPVTLLEPGWVNTNAMSVIDVASRQYVNTILLDDPDLGAANPYGVVCTADGKSILVTHAGTHELSVIDRIGLHERILPMQGVDDFFSEISSDAGPELFDQRYAAENIPNDQTFLTGLRKRITLKGNSPRGLVTVGRTAYIAEYFSGTIGVVDVDKYPRQKAGSISLGQEEALTEVRWGEMLFNDATLSFQKLHSCTSCHTGQARSGALNWDLLNDGIGTARNTKSLFLAHQTPPAMVTGVRADAEVAVRSGIRYIQFNFPPKEYPEAMDEYLKALEPMPSPYLVNGKLSPGAQKGVALFRQAGCTKCHPGSLHTDMKKHDVGTAGLMDEGGEYDTPTLVEVWRSAPYLHDGRATTVEEVLTTFNRNDRHGHTSSLGKEGIGYLAEYVLTR